MIKSFGVLLLQLIFVAAISLTTSCRMRDVVPRVECRDIVTPDGIQQYCEAIWEFPVSYASRTASSVSYAFRTASSVSDEESAPSTASDEETTSPLGSAEVDEGATSTDMTFSAIYFVEGYDTFISQDSPVGVINLYDFDDLIVDRLYTLWQTSGTTQSLSNPHDVYAWAAARVREYGGSLRVELRSPAIKVATNAPIGETSQLFTIGFFNEFPIGSASIEYVEEDGMWSREIASSPIKSLVK